MLRQRHYTRSISSQLKEHFHVTQEKFSRKYSTNFNITIILWHAVYLVLAAGREMVGLTQESLHVLMANYTGVIHSKVAMDKSGSGAVKTKG